MVMDNELGENCDFKSAKGHARKIIHEIYGHGTKNSEILLEKLDKCNTDDEITRVLRWGRVNLL